MATYRNAEQALGLIKQGVANLPELQLFPASPIKKTQYKATVRTALPSTGFRAANTGRSNAKSTLTSRTVECKILDASGSMDRAVSKDNEWGEDVAVADEQSAHVEGALTDVATQIYYGTDADAAGFVGVGSILAYTDSDMVVDAGGTTESTASSVYAFKFGRQECSLAWGNDGELEIDPVVKQLVLDETNGGFIPSWVWVILGWVGLQLVNYEAFGRLCNITEDSGKTLDDDMLAELIAQFPVGKKPDALFMSSRSMQQLRASRTATNGTGAPAPFPSEAFQVPIYESSVIVDTETLLVAESS